MPSDRDYAVARGAFLCIAVPVLLVCVAALYGVFALFGWLGVISLVLSVFLCLVTLRLITLLA